MEGYKIVRRLRNFGNFVLNLETWPSHAGRGAPARLDMEVYRNRNGDMVDCRFRKKRPGLIRFLAKHFIMPQKATPEHSVCSIGRGSKGVWWGWSHRAICGFRKGDRIFEARFPGKTDKTPFRKHGRKVIVTERDAKTSARRFARSVS